MDEYEKALLDEKLRFIQEHLENPMETAVTYFQPDERKSGGKYVLHTGRVKKIDLYERLLIMAEGVRIPIGDIIGVEIV